MAVPVRTCVGCRGRKLQSELVRFVLEPEGGLRVDMGRGLQGRSAYVCPDVRCVDKALRSKGFARSFRRSVSVPPRRELLEAVSEELNRRLAMASRGGSSGRRTRRLADLLEKWERSLALLEDLQGSGSA